VIVSIHQPQYIPWIPYFAKINQSDLFVLLDDVQYQKNGLQNRNFILTQNGTTRLTLSVKGNFGDKINQMALSDKRDLKKHLKTIELAYKKAPAFDALMPHLSEIYARDYNLLEEFCSELIIFLCNFMGIKTKIMKASAIQKQGEKSELILSICKQLNATTYLTGSGGLNYLDIQSFVNANINIELMEYKFLEYNQINNTTVFKTELSILDLVFNEGRNAVEYL
jgi:hypothetical protein